jgi:hypothetical protein
LFEGDITTTTPRKEPAATAAAAPAAAAAAAAAALMYLPRLVDLYSVLLRFMQPDKLNVPRAGRGIIAFPNDCLSMVIERERKDFIFFGVTLLL